MDRHQRMKYSNLIFLIIVVSCSTPKDKPDNSADTDTVSKNVQLIIKEDTLPLTQTKQFDTDKFNKLVDSLISIIADEKLKFICSVDTTRKASARHGFHNYLFRPQDAYMINYRFYPGKNRSLLRFKVMQIVYKDNSSLDEAFTNLRKDADSMYVDTTNSAHNFSPGLTYESDYVLKTDKQIFWLNLPCPYGTKNVLRLRNIFKSCLNIPPIKDSIICWCGQGHCDPRQ